MSSTFKSHSIDNFDHSYFQCAPNKTWHSNKYATIEKSQNFSYRSQQQLEMPKCKLFSANCDWLRRHFIQHNNVRPSRPLTRSQSNVAYSRSNVMQNAQKSINRNGTIARNHFRGVPGAYIDKQTKHFLLSMTVSISNNIWLNQP